MKKIIWFPVILFCIVIFFSFTIRVSEPSSYLLLYKERIASFKQKQASVIESLSENQQLNNTVKEQIIEKINTARLHLKTVDFWFRYLEPIAQKKINGPLPVEWETEVFEKFEAPYKREGAGLMLAASYLEEDNTKKDSLENLLKLSISATNIYLEDSITRNLNTHHHFFLTNRLFLLNLAAIYTTGFECPDSSRIIPELLYMLESVKDIYTAYNKSFPAYPLGQDYLDLFNNATSFVKHQPVQYSEFDHFSFIQKMINPLYRFNQKMMLAYKVRSSSFVDYSLNKYATSIFDKSLFRGQNAKGIFIGITDPQQLDELKQVGKLLFYDPILSGNNKRSCASCHKPGEYFTDTTVAVNLKFDHDGMLSRNTPSLLNTAHNHLLMMDGKHISLENQGKGVITNPDEMAGEEAEILKKILSCNQYKTIFKKYLKETPAYENVSLDHVVSAIMLYYSDLSYYYSAFDKAINDMQALSDDAINGFNIFMSKAQCATCHFVPQFNGVKPPYTSSEFEVIGVPADKKFESLSTDKGRYDINPVQEMASAFRTSTVRNTSFTKPYMHNGVFTTLEEVIDFYDAGGGAGKGLRIANQTLPSDSLKLSKKEKADLLLFLGTLNEDIPSQKAPVSLPVSTNKDLNKRIIGGEY